ncbi:hypothetical protein TNCV_4679671 [Trichonephila clavipes]|nr:hypothetical protein TNCV_4679671 [Trichonephila clavipes]
MLHSNSRLLEGGNLAPSSRRLSPAQRRQSAYDRELLAAYMTIKYFRYMGELTLFTDHKPLVYAFKQKEDNALRDS